MSQPTALLLSRDPSLIHSVRQAVTSVDHLGLEVSPAGEVAAARLHRGDVALVLAHHDGQDRTEAEIAALLRAAAAGDCSCATLVLAAGCSEVQATTLLRAGAADCLFAPLDSERLTRLADALTLRARLSAPPLPPAVANSAALDREVEPFFGALPGLADLRRQVLRVAPQETTLLLTGETGTGKTRLARLIHDLSPRRAEPFLVVDCGALSAGLVESELFGHTRGAFTGADCDRKGKLAAAGRGTLLLDEINSLPAALQGKLLRAVDERVFEPVGSNRPQPMQARLVAVSNVPLEREVAAGRFRADLYYRLNVVAFALPPLRERRQAITPLARRFLAEFARGSRPDVTGLDPGALRALEDYDWPGNVRELRNALERAVALCPGPEVHAHDLPESIRSARASEPVDRLPWQPGPATPEAPSTLSRSKEEAEVRRILEALHKHRNNRLRAAAELGISRMGLYNKLHKYGLMAHCGPAPVEASCAVPCG